MSTVKVWTEKVIIPTYEIGTPEKNPIFLEKRVYQGSSGAVYPHPVIEKIFDEKIDKEWLACNLENDFVKIMILPELGGRVQMAYDKIKQRHFVYYNEVIKPALVGLTGPWISGGIEFNWPQHHRPSTYEPVDYTIEENKDGSKTVWCSEIERMFRTKGMTGFTIYPDKAYLEIKVKLYNRTALPQTFLWWANPAVQVNDDYQSVFPPDVNAVFDHGKRDVSKFPIASGVYYKMDYSAGVDISRYKNIPVPTSYMAIKSDYNFVGGYEHDSKGGLLHVANHHVSPGKKQWTWGNGDFGVAWDRNLTDSNGPYIELMCGVYTDNQPDFSWIMPYEEKTFNQYFMPYHDLGLVKNASKDAMVNIEFENSKVIVKAFTTGVFKNVKIKLSLRDKIIFEEKLDMSPMKTFEKIVDKNKETANYEYKISVVDSNGKTLIDWSPEKSDIKELPNAASPARLPSEIKSNEELFINGMHLEQYRHATYNAADYYNEALARDPKDIRSNNALGKLALKKGLFSEAENYFITAYERQIERNPNPYDGEPLFNLGLSLRFQNKHNEAYEAFYKSVWNAAFMDSGYFQIAQIDALQNRWDEALETINRSLIRNWSNHKARHLKTAILRKLNSKEKALQLITESLEMDAFNFALYFEKYLLGEDSSLDEMRKMMRGNIHNYIEIALDYNWSGMYDEAIQLLNIGIEQQKNIYPMAYYYVGWFQSQQNKNKEAIESFQKAEKCLSDYCFPHQLESVNALNTAMILNPNDSKAYYYLGNFYYNARVYNQAQKLWQKSSSIDDQFPTAHRNLALAYYNKQNLPEKALMELEKAFSLDTNDSRVCMELDQLYKKMNKSVTFRLKFLEQNILLVNERDDLYLERIALLNLMGAHEKSYDLIMSRKFHPWEGGEGKVTGQYMLSLVEMAKQKIANNDFTQAIECIEKAKVFPTNLGEGKLRNAQENDIDYWLGCAHFGLHNTEQAIYYWNKASSGMSELSAALFYNDQQPDKLFYQGLALIKLNKTDEANSCFNKLIDYGEKNIFQKVKIDYFAVSLPDLLIWDEDMNVRNSMHCRYLMGLGYLGKEDRIKKDFCFAEIINHDCSHSGAVIHSRM